ncbi:MAG: ParB N-terminal domain-containing protein [Alkalinema sp. RL_2_19]|nr:ParB N-terminal domain-containing protein [Alkalinema sp. RL_2_19]
MGRFSKVATSAVKPIVPAPPTNSRLPLDQIIPRDTDTRPLNQAHVESLAESIAAVGLIQPLAVDNRGRLLAGGHRRAAIGQLQSVNPAAYQQWFGGGVPVHCFDFDAPRMKQGHWRSKPAKMRSAGTIPQVR